MNFVRIGKLVNTHGIKGEVRILSDFDRKELVFKHDMKLYIGDDRECVTIDSYRVHKNFDMCVFKEYNYINDVLKFKGKPVYVSRDDLCLSDNDYVDWDLIGLNAIYLDDVIGVIDDLINNNGYKLVLLSNGKYIPYNKAFISDVSLKDGYVKFVNLEGLL